MKKIILYAVLNTLIWDNAVAQNSTATVNTSDTQPTKKQKLTAEYPEIGKKMPDFYLKNLHYYSKEKISLEDLKGKYIILDFGASWCSVCFKSYPKINQLQEQFKDSLQFFLVMYEDSIVKKVYEKYRTKQHHNLPVAYDSATWTKLVPRSVPHYIWIDKEGIVQAITSIIDVNADKIQAFITAKKFNYSDVSAKKVRWQSQVNISDYFYKTNLDVKDSTGLIFASGFTKGGSKTLQMVPPTMDFILRRTGKIIVNNGWPQNLYLLAYFGYSTGQINSTPLDSYNTNCKYIINESSDSSILKIEDRENKLMNYVLIPPSGKKDVSYCQKIMQNDLRNLYGLDAKVEKRVVPVYYLKATDAARSKLKAKGDTSSIIVNPARVRQTNTSVKGLITLLSKFTYPHSVLDRTNIEGNIDIDLDALLLDKNDLITEFEKIGLTLVKDTKEMNVIVLRDLKE